MASATRACNCIDIAIVAAHDVVRAGLKSLLATEHAIAIVAEASSMAEAVSMATDRRADVTLVDLDSDAIPLHTISELVDAGTRVLVLTGTPDIRVHSRIFEFGAVGLVSKDQSTTALVHAIQKVHAGEMWLEAANAPRLLSTLLGHNDPERNRIRTLTKREREVLSLIGQGLRNASIGERLFISQATARNHVTSILSKLELSDRVELVLYALRHGLAAFDRSASRSETGASESANPVRRKA
jgi:DNA-binding NarL/FixJ family response regulator